MPTLADKGSAISPAPDVLNLPGKLPRIPGAVIDRFPEMESFQREWDKWWQQVQITLSETNEDGATVVNQTYSDNKNLIIRVGDLSAQITTIEETIIVGDAALARRIVTVSAMAGVPSNITVNATPPGAPAMNDYWIDTTDPVTPITKRWDGAAWVEVTTPISYAGVAQETTARITAVSAEATTRSSADVVLQNNINTVSASVTTETAARVSADSALATSISTVSASLTTETTNRTNADTTLQTNINTVSASVTTEATARASADTALSSSITTVSASLTTETSSRISADSTLQTNINTVSASVTTEATARATADGFLSGKYTLTVAAGDVVTGMNITSSSGSGTNISDVTFVATNFKIYNGTIGKTMFSVSGSDVQLAGTLTVSTSGKVYIGTGTFNNTNTSFYVDSAGQFSLKDKLSWNGTTLTINGGGTFSGTLSAASGSFSGTITSTSGTIGGFTIGGASLTSGSGNAHVVMDSSTGLFAAGTSPGQNVVLSYLGLTCYDGSPNLQRAVIGSGGASSGGQLAIYDSSAAIFFGVGVADANLRYGNNTSLPGYGNTDTGFVVESGSNALFVSRGDSNFAAQFNHNADGSLVLFARSGTVVGSVSVTSTNTAYNTSSDRRIKTAIADAGDVGSIIDGIKVREFEFIRDPGKRVLGFIAQELFESFPAAVTPGDDNTQITEMWQMDRSAVVPLLMKEIQSHRRRLEALEGVAV